MKGCFATQARLLQYLDDVRHYGQHGPPRNEFLQGLGRLERDGGDEVFASGSGRRQTAIGNVAHESAGGRSGAGIRTRQHVVVQDVRNLTPERGFDNVSDG